MSRVFLKNICLLLLTVLSATSCGLARKIFDLPPLHRQKAVFPVELAGPHKDAAVMAEECRNGEYAGQPVMDSFKQRIRAPAHWIRYSGRDTGGNGKIYTLHLESRDTFPPVSDKYLRQSTGKGYSFTLHTTDEDMIIECRAEELYIF